MEVWGGNIILCHKTDLGFFHIGHCKDDANTPKEKREKGLTEGGMGRGQEWGGDREGEQWGGGRREGAGGRERRE